LSSGPPPIVGIDLGTTYSLVAVLRDGVPTPLPNALGEFLTPSAVSVDAQGKLLVGTAARARATTHPEQTALAFKRDMGTDRVYRLGPHSLTPQELSALVLGALKRDAEAALGQPVEEAVITVPAYFDDAQRQATRAAGEIAGLRVERILNEPTAASLAYGLHERSRELRAVVLDLGGGTFDVTVLEIIEGVIEIQASAGDSRLGGEDFVDVMAAAIATRIQTLHGRDPRAHPVGWARVREACEEAKRRLSHVEETRIALPQLPMADGGPLDLELPVTREEMEEAWAELLERIRTPISRTLRDARLRTDQIDEVLLVGGSTRMPCVVRLAAQIFGRLPLRSLPPDEAVVLGAAVQAALKQGDASLEDMVVTDIAPFTLGIETATLMGSQVVDGLFTPILDRGTVIPASRVKRFHTLHDFQRQIEVKVYQGEHSRCKDNRALGSYTIGPFAAERAGHEAVDVRFTYDLNGILEVETTTVSSGKVDVLVLEQTPGRMTSRQVEEARERMAGLKFHPRDSLPNATALARAEALFMELTGSQRDEVGSALSDFHAALEVQDAEAIRHCRERLNHLIEAYRRS
jgi:molecular chaperone HscC